jgi:hypothetical protein
MRRCVGAKTPDNNEMKLTKPAMVIAAPSSQLISVFDGHPARISKA